MCGIAGLVDHEGLDVIAAMTELQHHRGPDDGGIWGRPHHSGPSVFLGSRRLAILDLTPAGHMPMKSADGCAVIVFNGEIYNYPELRAELERRGFPFRSHTDTEVLLQLYREEGPAFVRRLNGIFAIAIWDEEKRQLFLARDHFGVKPLYYHESGGRFAFASEAKALFAVPGIVPELDPGALREYLAFLWVPEPNTLFAGVRKLPTGCTAVFREGSLEIQRYWSLSFPPRGHVYPISGPELVEELRERWLATVRSQLQSDVPVGADLSAGLDSSSIVAAMARVSSEPVRTFTIDFPAHAKRGEQMDDGEVAKRTAAALGCRHTQIVLEPDVAELAPKLVWHMDEPVADPAIITAYAVAREARNNVTVLMSGAGGDEVFAGYRKYRAHGLAQRYQRIPAPVRSGVIEPAVAALPSFAGTPLRHPVRMAQKLVRSGSLPPAQRFIGDSVYLDLAAQDVLLTPDWKRQAGPTDPRGRHLAHFDAVHGADFLNQMLYVDCQTFLPSLNLNYVDKMSMAASVEARVPFLDPSLVDWVAANVPPDDKIQGARTKAILRDAVAPWLPAEALNQPKAGFGAPIDYWCRSALTGMIDSLLSADTLRRRAMFEPGPVQRMVEEHRSGRREHGYRIWSLLTLELWMQAFLDASRPR